ncbi:MAG TPA: hypothetical protein VLG40_03050 [Candidatus Saccharimonas sp.]|nr:hypothetical protein [Candidatus Saccharimonas sp.]
MTTANGFEIVRAPEFVALDDPEGVYYALLSGEVTRHLYRNSGMGRDIETLEFSLRGRIGGDVFRADVEPYLVDGDPGLLLRYAAGDQNHRVFLVRQVQGWRFASLQLVYSDAALQIDDPNNDKVEAEMDKLKAALGELQRRVFGEGAFHDPQ